METAIADDVVSLLGETPEYLRSLAHNPSLAGAVWNACRRILYEDSVLPRETKYMIAYMTVRAYSSCPVCLDTHERMMAKIGIPSEILEQLRRDIEGLRLGERVKTLLALSYHMVRTFGVEGEKETYEKLLATLTSVYPREEAVEAVLIISLTKALQDFMHMLHLH
jgi:alkylhydroperoxidase family enzyme